jgi:hypothetical protein
LSLRSANNAHDGRGGRSGLARDSLDLSVRHCRGAEQCQREPTPSGPPGSHGWSCGATYA